MSSVVIRADGGHPHRELESITPDRAVEMYLQQRSPEVSEKTLQNQRYRLDRFLDWCTDNQVDDLTTLTGRDLHEYRTWRGQQVKTVTLRGELQTLRVFLEFVANIDGCQPGLREQITLPDIDPEEEAKDERLDEQHAKELLAYLDRFEYASRNHVVIAILWHTGIRLGSLRAFDLDDYNRDHRYLTLRHRPETDTPLKNGAAAERAISISPRYNQVITDYIDQNRIPATDDYGRNPLITSEHGRYSSTSIRNTVYLLTQPCTWKECPHDRSPTSCEWRNKDQAAGCPSSRSPHGIRRGYITYALRNNTPERIVEDRSNVSGDVLEQHYDERTERERMEARREFIDNLDQ